MRGRAAGPGRLLPTLLVSGTVLLGSALPAGAAPGTDDSGAPTVQITVDRLEPRTVTPGATVEVSGTLVNSGTETYTDLSVRVQRGDVLTTRAELAEELVTPAAAVTAIAPFAPVPGELQPHGQLPFSYTTTTDALQLVTDGVYPLLVNLNGTPGDGTAERVGQLSTQLVVRVPTTPPAAPTTVAWLWPITDRPHRDAAGAFTDDDLAAEVASGGRLDRAVQVLEQLPGAGPGPGGPAVPVTLAVDPALLEELSVMAAGRYTVGSGDDAETGAGTADAADLLDRLRRLAADLPVVALPYADVDADALVAADQAAVVTRSLPGTADGTAEQSGSTPTAAAATTTAGTTSGTDAPAGSTGLGAGAAIVRDVLGVDPRTDLAWPAGGALAPATLDTLQAGGVQTLVLTDSATTAGAAAIGGDGAPAVARTSVPASTGDVTALVGDHLLTELVAQATPGAGDGREIEQRYLAQLAVLASQLSTPDPAVQQSVLVVPPREVDPDPAVVTAMMADTVTQPWLAAAPVSQLGAGPPPATGTLVAPDAGLPAAGLAEIVATSAVRDAVAAAVVGDPATVLAGYDAAIARAASAEWRTDPDGFAASAEDLRTTVTALQEQVTLVAPVDGTYSLASSDSPLVLTVRNDLPFAVKVRLVLATRGNVGITTGDIGVTTLEPTSRTTLQVPTHLRQSGGFAVTARLTTPDGNGQLGDAVQLQVKSTAYGRITLGITIGAAVLLGLLFLRRGVRFVLQRRRGGPPDDQPVLDGVSSVPPTRSPV